jgi:hypothetical protein
MRHSPLGPAAGTLGTTGKPALGRLAARAGFVFMVPLSTNRRMPDSRPHRQRRPGASTSSSRAPPNTTAAALLTRAVEVDLFNERVHRHALAAHTAAGHPDQAGRLLAAYTARLAAIGEHPDPDTDRLAG